MPTTHGWYAWYNKMPSPAPSDSPLRVTLYCDFPTSGYTAQLEDGNEGPYDIPNFVALKLVITPPDAGQAVLDVITTVPVYREVDEQDVQLVRVDGVDLPDGRGSIYVPVEFVY